MKTLGIIQARLASTRLPGKVLADLRGRPMLAWLLDRVKAVPNLDDLVVATTTSPEDDRLAAWLDARGDVKWFRGSEDDVLDRYYQCAVKFGGDVIVRITADDPLTDPEVTADAIRGVTEPPGCDYCSNTVKATFPEGLDVEAFTMETLARAHREAKLPSEREHVTPYVWGHPELFRLKSFEYEEDLSSWRWTVDKQADLDFMEAVLARFPDPLVPYRDVIAYLKEHPEIREINSGTKRWEGYFKSIEAERK